MGEDEFKKQCLGEFKPEPTTERIYVFAADHTAYLSFIRDNGLDRSKYRFIDKAESLRGTLRARVIFLNSCWANRNYHEISRMLRERGVIEVKLCGI